MPSAYRDICAHTCVYIYELYINIGDNKDLLVMVYAESLAYLCSLFSLAFWMNRLQQSIIRPHRKNSACFSLRTKVYKMRFDSSTLNSTGDVSLGEISTP